MRESMCTHTGLSKGVGVETEAENLKQTPL